MQWLISFYYSLYDPTTLITRNKKHGCTMESTTHLLWDSALITKWKNKEGTLAFSSKNKSLLKAGKYY